MSRLRRQLIRHEGLSLKPYRCPAGKLTIGVGRNLDDKGITEMEAMRLLTNDIEECEAELVAKFDFFLRLSAVRQDVLINMCFNLGLSRLIGFKRMLSALNCSDYDNAAEEMLDSRWARQVGSRAEELAYQMRTGRWRDE